MGTFARLLLVLLVAAIAGWWAASLLATGPVREASWALSVRRTNAEAARWLLDRSYPCPPTADEVLAEPASDPAARAVEGAAGGDYRPLSWTDKDGVQHFVEDPDLVPAEYRKVAARRELPTVKVYKGSFTRVGKLTRGVKAAKSVAAPQPAAPGEKPKAVVYSAKWCGACREAKGYLESIGAEVVERDIDEDSAALAELVKLAGEDAAIPVTVIGESVVAGFDPEGLAAAVERARR
jgi:glutaredoxin